MGRCALVFRKEVFPSPDGVDKWRVAFRARRDEEAKKWMERWGELGRPGRRNEETGALSGGWMAMVKKIGWLVREDPALLWGEVGRWACTQVERGVFCYCEGETDEGASE